MIFDKPFFLPFQLLHSFKVSWNMTFSDVSDHSGRSTGLSHWLGVTQSTLLGRYTALLAVAELDVQLSTAFHPDLKTILAANKHTERREKMQHSLRRFVGIVKQRSQVLKSCTLFLSITTVPIGQL